MKLFILTCLLMTAAAQAQVHKYYGELVAIRGHFTPAEYRKILQELDQERKDKFKAFAAAKPYSTYKEEPFQHILDIKNMKHHQSVTHLELRTAGGTGILAINNEHISPFLFDLGQMKKRVAEQKQYLENKFTPAALKESNRCQCKMWPSTQDKLSDLYGKLKTLESMLNARSSTSDQSAMRILDLAQQVSVSPKPIDYMVQMESGKELEALTKNHALIEMKMPQQRADATFVHHPEVSKVVIAN